jgi:inorganic pyrophosphatase
MNLEIIGPGNIPEELNVVVEISMNSPTPIKYEYSAEKGCLVVDRFLASPMMYPFNYGFVPGTLSNDGDPLDVVIVSDVPVMSGAMMSVKPVGVLLTEDEEGKDEKIIAVPGSKLNSVWSDISSYSELPELTLERIKHFYENYKDLEKGKWIKVYGFSGVEEAKKIILLSIDRYKK